MSRFLKALVVVLAPSALSASAASAAAFTSSAATTNVVGGQVTKHIFRLTNAEVRCGSIILTGHMTNSTQSELTISPEYTDCHVVFNGITVNLKVTGFGHYEGEAKSYAYVFKADGKTDLVCDAGAEVTIDAATCIVHIPPQNNLGKVTYEDLGNNLKASINLSGITTNHTDGFGCPFTSGGHSATGTLTGTSEVSGKDGGGAAANLGIE